MSTKINFDSNKRRLLLSFLLPLSSVACVSVLKTPAQEDPLTGLVSRSQLKNAVGNLPSVKDKKLALIYSVNVPKTLDVNRQLASRFGDSMTAFLTSSSTALGEDASIVFSAEKLLDACFEPLKKRFQSVSLASDLPDAFSKGADYVGIVDLRLEYLINENDPDHAKHTHMVITHISNISILLINRKLEAGPNLVSNVEHQQRTIAAGAEANNRDFINNVRLARVKMLRAFQSHISEKIPS